jgi:hypothetical protein
MRLSPQPHIKDSCDIFLEFLVLTVTSQKLIKILIFKVLPSFQNKLFCGPKKSQYNHNHRMNRYLVKKN